MTRQKKYYYGRKYYDRQNNRRKAAHHRRVLASYVKCERGPVSFSRAADGRFGPPADAPCNFGQARQSYDTYLAAVCAHQGLTRREVERQLARPVGEVRRPFGFRKIEVDRDWKAAVYARQLAMHLANTSDNVPQVRLAQVTGLTPAAVCLALRAIEDLRDHGDYDVGIEIIAAAMAAPVQAERAP